MTRHRTPLILAAGALAAALAASSAADARPSDMGDSYINDLQHNPRLIEPYQGQDSRRYRIGNPYAGYDDRQLARRGYDDADRGYSSMPRGRVTVEPYYAR